VCVSLSDGVGLSECLWACSLNVCVSVSQCVSVSVCSPELRSKAIDMLLILYVLV